MAYYADFSWTLRNPKVLSYNSQIALLHWLETNDIFKGCVKNLRAIKKTREKKRRYPPITIQNFKINLDHCVKKYRLTVAQRTNLVKEGHDIPNSYHIRVTSFVLVLLYMFF